MDQKKQTITQEEMNTYREVASIPYVAHEISERRHEKREKRFWGVIVLLIALLFLSNMIWLYVFQSYDTISYAQDGNGNNNLVSGTAGDIYNYEPKAENTP